MSFKGESVILDCEVDKMYESCAFIREDKNCKVYFMPELHRKVDPLFFKYMASRNLDPFKVDCDESFDFRNKVDFTDESKKLNSTKCSFRINNVTPEDAGKYTCELERSI